MDTALQQVERAYADSQEPPVYSDRILDWEGVTIAPSNRDELASCLWAIGQYNDFDHEYVLDVLADYPGLTVRIARESSVALYFDGFASSNDLVVLVQRLNPDESGIESNPDDKQEYSLRCWWD